MESEIVRLEPWADGDLPLLHGLLGDPEMTKHLGGPESAEKLAERHAKYLAHQDLAEGPQFRVVHVPTGEAVGWVGYWERVWQGEKTYEVGWSVLPKFQGQGIGARATTRAMEVARSHGRHRYVHAFPAATNGPSNAICRKVGFTFLGEVSVEYPPGTSVLCNDWRLDLHAPSLEDRFKGCFLGGAVGDALGAPVEFLTRRQIVERFGPGGIADFAEAYGVTGGITDDTQMTLFTVEGLLRAADRGKEKGIWWPPPFIFYAYRHWLQTQGEKVPDPPRVSVSNRSTLGGEHRSDLLELPELHARRAPGNTCLSALLAGRFGSTVERLNNSKGSGGVMRIAPVGLVIAEPFRWGCDIAALTHGHPSGYLAAGFLTVVIRSLREGRTLDEGIDRALAELTKLDDPDDVLSAVHAARAAADRGASVELVESLGEGWVAEEALAIALYCALAAEDFESGVSLAVNHGGDSDTTGSIAGSLLGTMHGASSIPDRWLSRLELRATIEELADTLFDCFESPS